MFSVYDKSGLHLAYPGNWTLEETLATTSDEDEPTVQLTISSPNTAFWTLACFNGQHDLTGIVEQVVSALLAEYPDLECTPLKETIGGQELTGQEVNFICLDLTNTAQVRACHRDGTTLLLFSQSEDRELEKVGPVLEAITMSLLSESAAKFQ